MSTYYGPIGLALRDVGAGFGELLKSEAERRDAGLRREVALGQLGIQKAQVEAQGAQGLAQLGIQQAQVGSQQREFEARQELAERQLQHQQFRDLKADTLAQGQLGVAEASRLATERYQGRTATTAEAAERRALRILEESTIPQSNAAIGASNAVATYNRGHAAYMEALRTPLALQNEAQQQVVNLDEFTAQAFGKNEPMVRAALAFLASRAPGSEAATLTTNEQGQRLIAAGVLDARLKTFIPIAKLMFKETPSEVEISKATQESYAVFSDAQRLTIPYPDHQVMTRAQLLKPAEYYTGQAQVDQELRPKIVALEEARFQARTGKKPARAVDTKQDDYVQTINKAVDYTLQQLRVQSAHEVLGTQPSRTPSTPIPPGAEVSEQLRPVLEHPGFRALPAATQQMILAETQAQAQRIGRPPGELAALFHAESDFRPEVVNPTSGATGLGQLVGSTARRYGVTDAKNIHQNIQGSAEEWARAMRAADNDPIRAYRDYYHSNPTSAELERFRQALHKYGVLTTATEQRSGLQGRTLPPVLATAPHKIARGLSNVYRTLSEGGTPAPPVTPSAFVPGLAGAGLSDADRYLAR